MVHPTCFVLVRAATSVKPSRVLRFLGKEVPPRDLAKAISESGTEIEAPTNNPAEWHLERADVVSLLRGLTSQHAPLKEFTGGKIYRGIISGLNEAFVVSTQQRDEMIKHAPSANFLKPLLEGTHLRPWYQAKSDEWLIVIPHGWTNKNGQFATEEDAWSWFERSLPSLASHLGAFEKQARKRLDKGEYWWELRTCDYYEAFLAPKILWPDIAKLPRFSIDTSGCFIGSTSFCVPAADFFLLGILNSWLSWYVISKTAQPLRLRAGRWQYRCKRQYMELLPVPAADEDSRESIASLARGISKLARSSYELGLKVTHRLSSTFAQRSESSMSQRLLEWPSLSFEDVGGELKKSLRLKENPWSNPAIADKWEPYTKSGKFARSYSTDYVDWAR